MTARLSLRVRALLALVLAAGASGGLTWFATRALLRTRIDQDLRDRAALIGRVIDGTYARAANPQGLLSTLLDQDADLSYVVVLGANDQPLAAVAREIEGWAVDDSEWLGELIRRHRSGIDADIVRHEAMVIVALEDEDEVVEREGVWFDAEGARGDGRGRGIDGTALLGLSPALQLERAATVLRNALLFSSGVLAILVWFFVGGIFRRIHRLMAYAAKLASGDLTQIYGDKSGDEFGKLGRALESITHNLGETISHVRVASIELEAMSGQVRDASQKIAGDAGTQALAVRQTGKAMQMMSDGSKSTEAQLGEAARSAEVGTERLRQIAGAIEAIAASVHQIADALDIAQGHAGSTVGSLAEVDAAVDSLNEAAAGTAAAMTQMAASVRAVEQSAERAFDKSTLASGKAESGVQAVSETRDGILRIREVTDNSVEAIRFLSEKVASIEGLLDVINDLANQTKLLSLNASIIASQAGEHGRGFLVVADEIKALALKTAGSTGEIAAVINEVLSVSGKTLDVVEKGVVTVDEAMVRSDHASQVLSEVLAASSDVGGLVRGIATAAAEHAYGAVRADKAMQDVHGTAVRLRDVVSAQKTSARDLKAAVSRMRELMSTSLATLRDQANQVDDALTAMNSVFDQIRDAESTQRGQGATREDLSKAFDVLAELSARNRESARSLSSIVEQASSQTAALVDGVRSFRV